MTKASLCPFSVHLTMCFANKTLIYHHLQCPFDIVSEGPKRTHHHSCPGPLSGSGSRNGILHSLQSAQRILFSSRLLYLQISHMCLASLSSSACCLLCLSFNTISGIASMMTTMGYLYAPILGWIPGITTAVFHIRLNMLLVEIISLEMWENFVTRGLKKNCIKDCIGIKEALRLLWAITGLLGRRRLEASVTLLPHLL